MEIVVVISLELVEYIIKWMPKLYKIINKWIPKENTKAFKRRQGRSRWNPYHVVTPRPWPFLTSLGALFIAVGTVVWMWTSLLHILMFGIYMVVCSAVQWWRDIVRESTLQGKHTSKVEDGLRLGMLLFILREVMLFVSFF